MRALVLLFSLLIVPVYAAPLRIDNAIVLIADVSSSMDDEEKRMVRESHALAISSPDVIEAILSGGYQRSAFAYVEFSNNAVVIVDWTLVDSAQGALDFADAILAEDPDRPLSQSTAIGAALALSYELMQRLPYEALFKTVDVAGDGHSNHGAPVDVPRALLLAEGVTINGLPMTLRPDMASLDTYYIEHVIGGPRAFSIELRDIADMTRLLRRKLIMELG